MSQVTPETDSGGSQSTWMASHDHHPHMLLDEKIAKAGFMDQLRALLTRNLILKKRDKQKTLSEFLMPLYFILILAIIRMAIKDKKYDPITEPHGSALLMKSLPYLLQGYPLHIAPNTTEVCNIFVMSGSN
nr:uncharacterized protein LOC128692080 [Cherax quadricarinatus]